MEISDLKDDVGGEDYTPTGEIVACLFWFACFSVCFGNS